MFLILCPKNRAKLLTPPASVVLVEKSVRARNVARRRKLNFHIVIC